MEEKCISVEKMESSYVIKNNEGVSIGKIEWNKKDCNYKYSSSIFHKFITFCFVISIKQKKSYYF